MGAWLPQVWKRVSMHSAPHPLVTLWGRSRRGRGGEEIEREGDIPVITGGVMGNSQVVGRLVEYGEDRRQH